MAAEVSVLSRGIFSDLVLPGYILCFKITAIDSTTVFILSSSMRFPLSNLLCRVFVGTVSEFCAKHAECPVITIKRKPDETPEDPVDD